MRWDRVHSVLIGDSEIQGVSLHSKVTDTWSSTSVAVAGPACEVCFLGLLSALQETHSQGRRVHNVHQDEQ